MASIVIRNLDEALKGRLRVRAAHNGRSMEAEVREILRTELGGDSPPHRIPRPPIVPTFVEVPAPEIEAAPVSVREPPEFD
jgi:hypothetical protein